MTGKNIYPLPRRTKLSQITQRIYLLSQSQEMLLINWRESINKSRIVKNILPGGSRKKGNAKSDPSKKNIPPEFRVEQYPQELLTVDAWKLFCNYCTTVVSTKKSTFNRHIESPSHKEKKIAYYQKLSNDKIYADKIRSKVLKVDLITPVNFDVLMSRMRVTSVFASEGIPLEKMRKDNNPLRLLLEEGLKFTLPMCQLSDLIPSTLQLYLQNLIFYGMNILFFIINYYDTSIAFSWIIYNSHI